MRFLARISRAALGAALLVLPCAAANRFVEQGVPAPTRQWSAEDYGRVAHLVTAGTVLPNLETEDGEVVLQRLTDLSNLALWRNQTIPLGQRFTATLEIQQAMGRILGKYAEEASREPAKAAKLHTELAMLMAFVLHVSGLMADQVEELKPLIQKDEHYATRMQGLRQMGAGTETMLSGVETSLGERHIYSESDMKLMVQALRENLPRLEPLISDDFKVEFRDRLRKRATESKDAALAADLLAAAARLE